MEKNIIKDALPLTETVAKIIFKNSYKYDDNTVMLAPTWNKGPVYKAGNYFVHADVIHSFKKL